MKPEWIAPHRTALILIDCQVDFGSPRWRDGAARRRHDQCPRPRPKPRCWRMRARRAVCLACSCGCSPIPAEKTEFLREGSARDDDEPDLCVEGTRGAEFIGPQPRPGETVISKTRFSAFAGTGLADHLRARGIDTLVLAGLTTECCVAVLGLGCA